MQYLTPASRHLLTSLIAAGILALGCSSAAYAATDQSSNSQQNGQSDSAQTQQSSDNGQATDDTGAANTSSASDQKNSNEFIQTQQSSQILASSIIGLSIQNGTDQDAKEIGTVNDLILNQDHQLVGIVVGIGGFLGIGQKDVAISWDAVNDIDTQKGRAVVNVTKEQLKDAPAFTSKKQKQKSAATSNIGND